MSGNKFQATSEVFTLRRGNSPLMVSMPHVGTQLPEWLVSRMNQEVLLLPDTDWLLEELYDFLDELDVTVIAAKYSRYVVDLNRSSDDVSLYPGQKVTGLCPTDTFEDSQVYSGSDALPDSEEILQRVETFWQPYHQTIMAELARIKQLHGSAMLWDAHSIRSYVPRFFEGELPNLNIGTADDASCNPELTQIVAKTAEQSGQYSWVVNGRFKGGFITRNYGQPSEGVYAIQMETAIRSYMDESDLDSPALNEDKAKILRPVLKEMMINMLHWHQQQRK